MGDYLANIGQDETGPYGGAPSYKPYVFQTMMKNKYAPKPPDAPREERVNAAPTLAEIWRRRGMLGQKAMDKEGTKYQIGG